MQSIILFFLAVKSIQETISKGKSLGKFSGINEPFKEDIMVIKNIIDGGSATQAKLKSDIETVANILRGVKASADAEDVDNVFGGLIKKLESRLSNLA